MQPTRVASLVLACAFATAGVDAQADWPQFRGPNGQGTAEASGIPVEFGREKNLVWSTPLAPGHSSPVVAGGKVFLTGFEGDDLHTYCLDAATGAVEWRRTIQRKRAAKLDKRNNPASATPAADADTVVVFFEDVGLLAYDHEGRRRWTVELGPFDNVYGMGASPVLVGDTVFQVCDQQLGSFLLAVDKATGTTRFRVPRKSATSGHCTPVVYRPESGAPQLIVPGSFLLDAYDTETGERVWWVRGLCFEMKSTPVLQDGVIYINGYGSPLNQPGKQVTVPSFAEALKTNDKNGDGMIDEKEMPKSRAQMFFSFVDLDKDGKLGAADWTYLENALASKNAMLAIKAGGRGDMTEKSVVWSYHRRVPQLPSPLLYGGVLYLLGDQSGLYTILDPKSGAEVEKGRLEGAVDNYYASPVAADGKVFFVSEGGLVSVVQPGAELRTLAVHDLGERCYSTPAIAAGRLLIRTEKTLFCFGTK